MKYLSFSFILIWCLFLIGCDDIGTSTTPPSVTRLIPGEWHTGTLEHRGSKRTIFYQSLTNSIDYSKISEPGDPNSSDVMMVLQGVIYNWKSDRVQELKTYFVTEDKYHRIPAAKKAELLDLETSKSDWKMTHLVCIGDVIIVRGHYTTAKGIREVDLWPFTQVDGKWKLNMYSPKSERIDWFTQLLFKDSVPFVSK